MLQLIWIIWRIMVTDAKIMVTAQETDGLLSTMDNAGYSGPLQQVNISRTTQPAPQIGFLTFQILQSSSLMTSNICFKDEYKHSFTKWTRLKLFIIKSYIMISICMELSIRLYGHSSFFCVCVSSPSFAMHRQVATSSNSLLLLHSRPTSPFFPFHLIQSVTFVKIWTQMNIRTYLNKKKLHE